MRIQVTSFNGKDVRVSMSAENEAEEHQLRGIMTQLEMTGANWSEWSDNEDGRSGIVIVAEKRSNV